MPVATSQPHGGRTRSFLESHGDWLLRNPVEVFVKTSSRGNEICPQNSGQKTHKNIRAQPFLIFLYYDFLWYKSSKLWNNRNWSM